MPPMNEPDANVYIVDGCRTPILKARGVPGPCSGADLAVAAGSALLLRAGVAADALDEVVLGCVMAAADEANIARVAALRIGVAQTTPAFTVQRNCASGMQALDTAAARIREGASQLTLAGGVEAMSRAPLLLNDGAVRWLAGLRGAKTAGARIKHIARLRPAHLKPVAALRRGLTDPVAGLSMGQTAEKIARRFGIDRDAMDRFALQSHRRLAHAIEQHHLDDEVAPLYCDGNGGIIEHDDGLRRDTSAAKLAKLKPVFEPLSGGVTAGNSAQVSDGAAWLLLASERALREHHLQPAGRIVAVEWAALDPSEMGLGPVHATGRLLRRLGLDARDIDYWELNEAFAGQVLACLAAFESRNYCRNEAGLEQAVGRIEQERLNTDGGAIACGHPVGMSGARITLHALNVLRRTGGKRAVATLCIGGGQGGAALIETV